MTASDHQSRFTERLARATFNYGLGRVLPQAIGFFLLPLYTAFLSPADFGLLDLATAATSVLVILMRLGMPGAVTRFYYEHKEGPPLRDYVTTMAWFQIGTSLVVSALTLGLWSLFAPRVLPGLDLMPFGLMTVIAAFMTGNSDLQRRLIQAREQSALSAKLSLANSLAQIALAIALVAGLKMGAVGMQLSFVIVGVVFAMQAFVYLAPDVKGHFKKELLGDSFRYAQGILPSQLIGELAPFATRSLLANEAGLGNLGVLAIASKFASPLAILVSAFSAAYLPVYFSTRKENTPESKARLATTAAAVWAGALVCTLGVALLGPPAIRIMTPARFHEAAPLVPVVALGSLAQIMYALASPEIYYAKRTLLVPFVAGIIAVTTIALTALLIGPFGPAGVAWATAGGLVAGAVLGALFSTRLVDIPYDWKRIGACTVVAGALGALGLWSATQAALFEAAVNGAALVAFAAFLWFTRDPIVNMARDMIARRFAGRTA